ncbi:MAG: mechanosensitive ion channel, partial [Deltaproteobacteria bacterium]|nr:mechanosensitive ion channel [Deltaproteobacteria bacterium]
MFPMLGMASAYVVLQFLIIQINITGKVIKYLVGGYDVTFHLFGVWGVICLGTIVKTALSKFMERRRPDVPKDMITLCVRLSVIGLVLMIMARGMERLGLPVTALFASAGVVGLAVALAARETLANFFGGVSLLTDKPFKVGDYIVLDSGERGEVRKVGMRSTRILTRDDILITIPNSLITNLKITNQSAPRPSFRVRLKVGVAYG